MQDRESGEQPQLPPPCSCGGSREDFQESDRESGLIQLTRLLFPIHRTKTDVYSCASKDIVETQ